VRTKMILLALTAFLCGCVAIKDENEIYGSYTLTSGEDKILLDIGASHSYSESLSFAGHPTQKAAGIWQWKDGRVCFASLLIPTSLMKDVYANARREEQPKIVEGAYQLDDCVPATKEYGKTILEISPDKPENFVKTSANRQ
jgi:hypothetical protein